MAATEQKMKAFTFAKWESINESLSRGFLRIQPELIDSQLEKVSGFSLIKPEVLADKDSQTISEHTEKVPEVKTLSLEENIELRIIQAQEEASRAARTELEKEYQTRIEEIKAKHQEFITSQINAWKELEIKHETKCLELALAVAKKILSVTVEIKPDYIQEVIKEALAQLSGTTPLKVKVSHQDYEFIEVVGLPRELSAAELNLVYELDDTISSGCVIETNYGEVDFVLENMFERIKKSIIEALK